MQQFHVSVPSDLISFYTVKETPNSRFFHFCDGALRFLPEKTTRCTCQWSFFGSTRFCFGDESGPVDQGGFDRFQTRVTCVIMYLLSLLSQDVTNNHFQEPSQNIFIPLMEEILHHLGSIKPCK